MAYIFAARDPSRPQWDMTLGELLEQAAEALPEKAYLYFYDQRVTYQQLRENSLKAARVFQDMGVSRGDRVCLFLPNCPEFLYCWFGLGYLGAVGVPINTAYKEDEASYIVEHTEARLLLAHASLMDVAQKLRGRCKQLGVFLSLGSEGSRPSGWEDFSALLESATPQETRPEAAPQDLSMLIYTSGTTGRPKGVMITHQMYVAAGQGFATWTEASPEDRFFTCLPYFHANTHYYSTMGSLAAGASLAVVDRFSASHFWEQVRQSGATVVNFIGMMLPVLLKQPPAPEEREHRVRLFYGSPAYAPDMLAQFEERFRVKVLIGFGLTESCYGTIEPMGQVRRPGSSGLARWHPDPRFLNEIRIADERGRFLPAGQAGEIVIRNPAVTPGYWKDAERTQETLRGGWLHTGDLARMDGDGYLYFVDRKKDVIRRRGENISSQEVEEVVKRHPKVLDCAVVAVPSELGEDEVKAVVVLKQGEGIKPEEVVYWCADRLAYFKVPRYVEFRDDLPRTPSLRVRKDLLRQEHDPTKGCFDREKAGIRIR
ncbi:MAG: ATP-dependent acyl-CoA ligase [Chloroflexi bacterium]|nr:ATP-dependent acyl-CoA ligase [Chloroflexota bacterium]